MKEQSTGYEPYIGSAVKSLKLGARVGLKPVQKIFEAEKPILELYAKQKLVKVRKKLHALRKGV